MRRRSPATPSRTVRRVHALLLPVWTLAGALSKEIVATIPAALLLYDWLFLGEGVWRRMRPRLWLIGLTALPLVAGGLFLLLRAYSASTGLGVSRSLRADGHLDDLCR